jgi:hypothetical protein
MIAVNTWPIVILWYLGMVLVCCITIHGTTALDFGRSVLDPRRNHRLVDRILATRTGGSLRPSPLPPPSHHWNMWAWQNYRFEQNLLAQTAMVLRSHRDDIISAGNQLRQEQGLVVPPPSYEMKIKRYSKHDHDDRCHGPEHHADDNDNDDDNDSIHEPACTICFVPLEDGDIVGNLACQHVFHKDCLKLWLKRKNACPLCNTILATRRPDPPAPQDVPVVLAGNSNEL